MRDFDIGVEIDLTPEDTAHAQAADPHPAVPATLSRGEKVRGAPASFDDRGE